MNISISYEDVRQVDLVGDIDEPDTYKEPTIALRQSGSQLWINFNDCDDLLGFIEELQTHLAKCLCKRDLPAPEHSPLTRDHVCEPGCPGF